MEEVVVKLSPSSATDFKSCPQLFKFRAVDGLPEPLSPTAARGSLVHSVLERLFDEEPPARTPQAAAKILEQQWQRLLDDPDLGIREATTQQDPGWFAEARRLLDNYFKLEDPRVLMATRLEWRVEYELPGVHLRGVIDRLEERSDGSWVLTDYKTGRVPGEARELTAFFGLRFYALVCWRAFGVMPDEIRLIYLSDPAVLTLNPHERMLTAFEKQIDALGAAVRRAVTTGDWRTRPSPFCMSCGFQPCCPAWAPAEPSDLLGPPTQGEGPPDGGPGSTSDS